MHTMTPQELAFIADCDERWSIAGDFMIVVLIVVFVVSIIFVIKNRM
jgi:hypothetical protein